MGEVEVLEKGEGTLYAELFEIAEEDLIVS